MAPSKIETCLFTIAILLIVPFMLFSIQLHSFELPPDARSVPTDHFWRLNSLIKHNNNTLRGANSITKDQVRGDSTFSSVLKPGREAVEDWLRSHRSTLPSFIASGINMFDAQFEIIPPIHHYSEAGSPTSSYDSKLKSSSSISTEQIEKMTSALTKPGDVISKSVRNSPYSSPNKTLISLTHSAKIPSVVESLEQGSNGHIVEPVVTANRQVDRAHTFSSSSLALATSSSPMRSSMKATRCLLFTMDSIDNYIEKSKRGGASGEITIRESLVKHLAIVLNVVTDVARSDKEFETLARGIKQGVYSFVILDAWTWAAKGWVPKPPLIGFEHKVFLLDFFGAKQPTRNGIKVSRDRILTAFPTYPGNTFLGYAVPNSQLPSKSTSGMIQKKKQGVIWGKDPKHYKGRESMLKAVAAVATLHSTLSKKDAPPTLKSHPNIIWHGHQSKPQWQLLLAESMFMLGIGNPLVGPSAVDAVVAGCVYINPVYTAPVKEVYTSQHPYLERAVGSPHVCSAQLNDATAMAACAAQAIAQEVQPVIPQELTEAAYSIRIKDIFGPFVISH